MSLSFLIFRVQGRSLAPPLEMVVVVHSTKGVINLLRLLKTVKENHIGSVVTEILRYRQTDTLRSFYLIIRILILATLQMVMIVLVFFSFVKVVKTNMEQLGD